MHKNEPRHARHARKRERLSRADIINIAVNVLSLLANLAVFVLSAVNGPSVQQPVAPAPVTYCIAVHAPAYCPVTEVESPVSVSTCGECKTRSARGYCRLDSVCSRIFEPGKRAVRALLADAARTDAEIAAKTGSDPMTVARWRHRLEAHGVILALASVPAPSCWPTPRAATRRLLVPRAASPTRFTRNAASWSGAARYRPMPAASPGRAGAAPARRSAVSGRTPRRVRWPTPRG
jgi:hypothetical protein